MLTISTIGLVGDLRNYSYNQIKYVLSNLSKKCNFDLNNSFYVTSKKNGNLNLLKSIFNRKSVLDCTKSIKPIKNDSYDTLDFVNDISLNNNKYLVIFERYSKDEEEFLNYLCKSSNTQIYYVSKINNDLELNNMVITLTE